MQEINAKPVDELSWSDFKALFLVSGCTANYEEQLFYLPLAFAHLERNPDDGLEYLSDLVHFVSDHAKELERDGLFGPVEEAIWECFRSWTREFQIVHFDRDACRAKGWRREHFDYVVSSQAVHALLDDLTRLEAHRETAEAMVDSWMRPGRRDVDAAWILEHARQLREGLAHVPNRITPELLRAALDQARKSGVLSNSPTYGADLEQELGLGP